MTDNEFNTKQNSIPRLTLADNFNEVNTLTNINGKFIRNYNEFDNDVYGTRISIKELLGKPLIVARFKIENINRKDANDESIVRTRAKIQVVISSKESYVTYTESKFIISKLQQYRDKLPYRFTICKSGKTYVLL